MGLPNTPTVHVHSMHESKSAIHRLCYNMPFGGSFVGSS